MSKSNNRIFDILNIFSSAFLIALLFIVLYFSLDYFTENYRLDFSFKSRMFLIGIVISIITTTTSWIQGRAISMLRSIKNLKGGSKNGRRKCS